jgi:hypothetical protein
MAVTAAVQPPEFVRADAGEEAEGEVGDEVGAHRGGAGDEPGGLAGGDDAARGFAHDGLGDGRGGVGGDAAGVGWLTPSTQFV